MPENPLLTAEQVAEVLNVSRSKAFDLIRKGEIPAVRIGRIVRVRYEDLIGFITKHSDPGGDEGVEA